MEAAISTDLPTTPAVIPYDVWIVLLVFAGVALLVAAVRLIRIRMRDGREESRELPPLVYPARRSGPRPVPADEVMFRSSAPPAVETPRAPPSPAHLAVTPEVVVPDPDQQERTGNGRGATGSDLDATLQLLPGRLEPMNPAAHQEIRFVRVSGVKRFTLGRNAGPGRSHVQLHAATASRMHAYMEFEQGRWLLGNMSRTNSVLVNGQALNGDATCVLTEGDCIEFGELMFVFRER